MKRPELRKVDARATRKSTWKELDDEKTIFNFLPKEDDPHLVRDSRLPSTALRVESWSLMPIDVLNNIYFQICKSNSTYEETLSCSAEFGKFKEFQCFEPTVNHEVRWEEYPSHRIGMRRILFCLASLAIKMRQSASIVRHDNFYLFYLQRICETTKLQCQVSHKTFD